MSIVLHKKIGDFQAKMLENHQTFLIIKFYLRFSNISIAFFVISKAIESEIFPFLYSKHTVLLPWFSTKVTRVVERIFKGSDGRTSSKSFNADQNA